jgi:dephospho-CoA kinase
LIKVGLTGGYASGKSFVAQELERLGCHVIYADKLGHDVLLPDGEAYAPVLEAFGEGILEEDGSGDHKKIDRKKLGSLVFKSSERLARLTAIVHPAVFRLEERLLAEYEFADPKGIAVVEAAILIETGRFKVFDRLVVVICDLETQIARALKRDPVTREEVMARLEKQLPAQEKLKYADYVIDTSGGKEDTVLHVEAIYRELRELAQSEKQ